MHAELDKLLDKDTVIVYEHVKQLPYLQAVCKESLRLLPPVPFVARRIRQPMTLDNYVVPAGVEVRLIDVTVQFMSLTEFGLW